MPRYVHFVQIGGANVFERLTPTPEQRTSAYSAREGKREARELDGVTFKPQRLAAASDVSRHMLSDPPPGSARHVARMVPTTATMCISAECTFAPKVRVACVRRGGVTYHTKDHMKDHINGRINDQIQRSHPRISHQGSRPWSLTSAL